MKVTYLIGNGFDIACGLKTRYKDFIELYKDIPSSIKDVCDFKEIIRKDSETWADAEYAFGQLTEKIVDIDKFVKCYRDFLSQLSKYLTGQQSKIRYREIKKSEKRKFLKGLTDVFLCLNKKSKSTVNSCINILEPSPVEFNFLIFNYTSVFEVMLRKAIKACKDELCLVNCFDQKLEFKIGDIQYVHGSLKEPPMIFGVNDRDQISCTLHKGNNEMEQTMIKPICNQEIQPAVFDRCKEIIQNSDIICIYGMSLGVTDCLWWSEIVSWLHAKEKSNLIIFHWNPDYDVIFARDTIRTIEDCQMKLIANARSDKRTYEDLKDRIHVVINQNPFHIVMHS